MPQPTPDAVTRLAEVGLDFDTLVSHFQELVNHGVRDELSDAFVISEVQYLVTATDGIPADLAISSAEESSLMSYIRQAAAVTEGNTNVG